jgi:diguanylate cyclase (GGDEF)-like protein
MKPTIVTFKGIFTCKESSCQKAQGGKTVSPDHTSEHAKRFMADTEFNIEPIHPPKRLLFLVPLILLLIGGITYYVVQDAQHKIVEFQAVNVAEIVARQAAASRSVYASQIAGKLAKDGTGPHMNSQDNKGYVPIPAQFLKLVGREASATSDNLYRYKPISKWNLEPTQGLTTDFQKWAWMQLEAQDQSDPKGPIAWQPVWRFEDVDGANTLLYLRADPAAAENCVACHNSLEQSPEMIERRRVSGVPAQKQWKLHQLMGAIQVEIPLDKVGVMVESQTRQTLVWIMAVLGAGLIIATWFVFSDFTRAREIMRLSWLVSHDPVTGFYNNRAVGPLLERLIADAKTNAHQHALCYLQLLGLQGVAGSKEIEQLLKLVANGLRSWLPPKATIVRLHGLHFALLIPNCATQEAQNTAETLLRSIKTVRLNTAGKPLEIGAAIGVVLIRPQTDSADNALKAAEQACQTAAAKGSNQFQFG